MSFASTVPQPYSSPLVRRVREAARAVFVPTKPLLSAADVRLFAMTFGGGFIFVTLFLA